MNYSGRIAGMAWVSAAAVLGALAYGCSDDSSGAAATDAGADDGSADAARTEDAGREPAVDSGPAADAAAPLTATATIAALVDGGASGTALFVESNDSVAVSITLKGPPGVHGLHLHAGASCSDTTNDAGVVTTGGAAGGHFNPADAGHGYPDAGDHHAGDFGNITLDDAGNGTLRMTTGSIRVADGATSVVNHAIVVHATVDDGTTQPTGNSGGRIGCGVVKKGN